MTIRFDPLDSMSSYLELLASSPNLFKNSAGGIRIVTDPNEIEIAQAMTISRRAAAGDRVDDCRVGVIAIDPYMTILRDAVMFPDGSYGLHNRIIENGSIAVLPSYQGELVLLKVFRHGLRETTLEFPRGGRLQGESPEAAVRRELMEECGATATSVVELGRFTPGGSSLSVNAQLYMATLESLGRPQIEEGISEIMTVTSKELERMIARDEMIDGFSIALFARARAKKLL